MRSQTAGLTAQGGDRLATEHLKQVLHRRMQSLAGRPRRAAVLRPARLREPDLGAEPTSRSTSAAATSPTRPAATRSSSTGGRRSRCRSTGPAAPSRWACDAGAGSASSTAADGVRGRGPRSTRRRRAGARAAILEAEIERPRVGPMRDIVATIQPEQDDIVRAGLTRSRLRPGRARHRQDRGRPAPGGLPALRPPRPAEPVGRAGRRAQRSLPALHRRRAAGARRDRRHADHRRVAGRRTRPGAGPRRRPGRRRALKGDARMAEVLRRAVWEHVAPADRAPGRAARDPPLAGRRLPGRRGRRRAADPWRPVRAGRAMLPQRLAHPVLRRAWRRPATPPTTGCRPPWRAAAGEGLRRRRSGRRSTRPAGAAAAHASRRSWPRRPRAC